MTVPPHTEEYRPSIHTLVGYLRRMAATLGAGEPVRQSVADGAVRMAEEIAEEETR